MPNTTKHDRERNKEYLRSRYASDSDFRQRCIDNARRNGPIRRARIREWWFQMRAILRCELCEEDHPAALDFHHRDAKQKTKSVRAMVDGGYSQQRILAEIDKCRILCSNCHRKLHWDERPEASRESA